MKLNVEGVANKYGVMSLILNLGFDVTFFDLDVAWLRDPTEQILLEADGKEFMFGSEFVAQNLSPSIIYAKSTTLATLTIIYFAAWLYNNPFAFDYHGWDAFLVNPDADTTGSWDYQGREVTHFAESYRPMSFLPEGAPVGKASFGRLSHRFASGDGFTGPLEDLYSFHCWGSGLG